MKNTINYSKKVITALTVETINKKDLEKMYLVSQMMPDTFLRLDKNKILDIKHKLTLNLTNPLDDDIKKFIVKK